MEATPDLKRAIQEEDWEETSRILKDHPELAEEEVSFNEFDILWCDAPLGTIQALLKSWPDAYKELENFEDGEYRDLVEVKFIKREWDFLDSMFVEFPHVLKMKHASTAAKYDAPLEFLNKHWKETGTMLYSIHNKDWEKFGEILKDNLQVVKDGLSDDEYGILWSDAPLKTIRALLNASPEAYRHPHLYDRDLVHVQSRKKQWDCLDNIFQEFPQVLEMKYARTAAKHGASLDFLNKHWEETGKLLHSVHSKDWEKFGEMLRNYPQLTKDELFDDEFGILWRDAPFQTIRALLKVWPEAYKRKDDNGKSLVKVKLSIQEWDCLDTIFFEFPHIPELDCGASIAAIHGAPLEFLKKHWKEAGKLLHYVRNKDWEKFGEILRDHPELVKEQLTRNDFHTLWLDAPWEVIKALLQEWPEAYKEGEDRDLVSLRSVEGAWKREYGDGKNLVQVKLDNQQWDFLDTIFQEFPQVLEREYASTAASCGASFEFLTKHWKETGVLLYSVHSKDWEKFGEILNENLQVVKDRLSKYEFNILWSDAPFEIVQSLLKAWPEAYERQGTYDVSLVVLKLRAKQWDFLKSLIRAFPKIIGLTAYAMESACKEDVRLDIFKLMLDQQPDAPLEDTDIIIYLILKNKLQYFRAVLDRCPAATEVQDDFFYLTPLLLVFQQKKTMNTDWIDPILKANPNAARQTDFDGKTPLHLAYQHGASAELVEMLRNAYPDAENIRDNLGRLPKDLENQSEKTVFTPANEALILRDNVGAEKKSYPDNAVVLCRGDMLIRDPQLAENEDDKAYEDYAAQVLVRHSIFTTLLDEFSKVVGIDDKDVIQKAAAIQALAALYLSNEDRTIINFDMFENPGYWYQQEVLKLVMRVYHEGKSELDMTYPSVWKDADVCGNILYDTKNGEPAPEPSNEHVKAYNDLTRWLTQGLDKSSHSLQGPVLKPLQSLFNKLFIRRGQTSVSLIGDIVRGRLLVDDMEPLQKIVKRIKNTFPNITRFRQPNKFDKLVDFLTYVHDDLNLLPDSDNVLPYRLKVNSSQKNKKEPLWYNFNFFLQVPEYHRVGFSEMFVACELQIGLTKEIKKHSKVHDAYERDRILSNQPLLKNYDAMRCWASCIWKFVFRLENCTEDDTQVTEKVLFGKIASEVLIPCTTAENDSHNNMLSFEYGPFYLSNDEIMSGSFEKPEWQCINNRSLNWYALECPKAHTYGGICAAFRVADPYNLDKTKRYFVDSFVFKTLHSGGFYGTVGLYARVGPYLIQIACHSFCDDDDDDDDKTEDVVVVKSGQNLSYLEQVCPVPDGTTALEVIAYGLYDNEVAEEFKCDEIKLSLKVFDVVHLENN